MSDSETKHCTSSTKLTSSNYNVWAIALQGKLITINAWWIVTKDLKRSTKTGEALKWLLKREEATGILLKSLLPMQYVHVEGVMDDPIEMWKKLRAAHWLQIANSCFHAMQKLLSIWKDDTESLTDYITHINAATNDLIALTLSTLTIQNIVDEVSIHATITGLNQVEYGAFTSSLLLISTLDCTTISTAFHNEDLKHQVSSASTAAALVTTWGKKPPIPMYTVCRKWGHPADCCWIAHPNLKPMQKGEENKGKKSVHKAMESEQNRTMQELAKNASLHSSSPPSSSSDTNLCWNTDTGATSHMTPHHHWLQSYEPYCVPICLTTNEIVY